MLRPRTPGCVVGSSQSFLPISLLESRHICRRTLCAARGEGHLEAVVPTRDLDRTTQVGLHSPWNRPATKEHDSAYLRSMLNWRMSMCTDP